MIFAVKISANEKDNLDEQFNLLVKDLVKTHLAIHVTNILKYFRSHLLKAWYHEEDGSTLVLSLEVEWKT